MFTGLIEGVGRVVRMVSTGGAARLRADIGPMAEGVQHGDSIAVNGACLTVTQTGEVCEFDVSAETLRVTTLAALKPGDRLNIERALRVGDRLGGHFVLGHVDAVGDITALTRESGQTTLSVHAAPDIIEQLIPKGSVAVDGISLTVAAITTDGFSVAVIPATLDATTLGDKRSGDRVNLELDVIGKYVQRQIRAMQNRGSGASSALSPGFLAEHGFV